MIKKNTLIPAVRKMHDFEKALLTDHEWIVILETRLDKLLEIVKYLKQNNKKFLLHIDLIQGLKSDDFGFEFISNKIKPDGVISTRFNIIELAKKRGMLAIQRLFLLDSYSLENNIKTGNKFKPDYIEVLPGLLPNMIEEINAKTKIPIIAGGLIKTEEEKEAAFNAGAIAVSTSASNLW